MVQIERDIFYYDRSNFSEISLNNTCPREPRSTDEILRKAYLIIKISILLNLIVFDNRP